MWTLYYDLCLPLASCILATPESASFEWRATKLGGGCLPRGDVRTGENLGATGQREREVVVTCPCLFALTGIKFNDVRDPQVSRHQLHSSQDHVCQPGSGKHVAVDLLWRDRRKAAKERRSLDGVDMGP
ncbi:hypothetical protein BCR37DRAFT_231356 [Protomyces lactucae-debilis]|uniref:Secreted protein n=1 Tax=Protomyces lactucae-debilis TaxID=2754530 RepID=A0A1Y2ES86_PROLT|nr:uncharacterized protein BCR37DRAFT_231356 [Protomyces lactucae-debilis]ORY73705.1 hypothetical protein BCR37DRAFT_231356 [Protomyces lactucae-debilis]